MSSFSCPSQYELEKERRRGLLTRGFHLPSKIANAPRLPVSIKKQWQESRALSPLTVARAVAALSEQWSVVSGQWSVKTELKTLGF
jgi:hypothetical protein